MSRSDRVEELETQVRELEATVTGLTEELLECKQRLGELEDATEETDGEESWSMTSTSSSESSSSTDSSVTDSMSILDEVDTYTTEGDESQSETETEGDGDGIIVA
ncbi:DUF7518 family protein [Halocatena salina]|uniref:BZIP transcription factor n=1 Tax=Halocatena salina TaxID=2934340 RepID=A0A8T9ZZ77_9EURY|nr:hypothetical protein [Halocatena salina]UPM41766.1 hypothetical protein MW046_07135 [Halocatena salina]